MGLLNSVANACFKRSGWSPVGRLIRIVDAEGPAAEVLHLREAVITELIGEPTNEVGAIRIDLVQPITWSGRELRSLVLLPRHVGYDAYSLPITGIGVVVSGAEEQASKTSTADTLATATIALRKS